MNATTGVASALANALSNALAVGDANRATLAQPCVMAVAGQCDDARACTDRELGREGANAPCPRDHGRLARSRGDRTLGGDPRCACNEHRACHLPWDFGRFRDQVGRLDENVLRLACALVGIADYLVADGYAHHGPPTSSTTSARSEPWPLGNVSGKKSRTEPGRIVPSLGLL